MPGWIRCILLIWMLLAAPAWAESTLYTYSNDLASNLYYVCEDFTGDVPPEVLDALSGRLLAGDEILCGTILSEYLRSDPEEPRRAGALIAVRRKEKILLFGISDEEGICRAALETDSFFSDRQDFQLTVLPHYGINGGINDAHLAIVMGGEIFRLVVKPDAGLYLQEYEAFKEEGDRFCLTIRAGSMHAGIYRSGVLVHEERVGGLIPQRLCAWTYAHMPMGMAQVKAFAALNPVLLEDDEAVIYGVNFRKQATTKSPSMGQYTAKVRLLDRPKDASASWYHVAVGDTQGFVSSTYVVTKQSRANGQEQMEACLSEMLPVARADRETALADQPGGNGKMMLSSGKMMHVIASHEGWLHVVIPREEITWKTDWNGIYGYVREDAVTTGISIADVKWR